GQLTDPRDVDEHGGLGQPHLHHRQQRGPAGQQVRGLAVLGKQRQRVRRGVGDLVVERGRDHALTSEEASAPDSLPAAASTARTMLWYPVQRQKLLPSTSRTCCSGGSGFSASRLVAAITMPGVQNPHCRPWFS